MFNISESISQKFIDRSTTNLDWLIRRHGKPAPTPLVIDMESYGSMVETHKADILTLYLNEDRKDVIKAKKDIALEAISPKPDIEILSCLQSLVVKTGRYSKIIIVDKPDADVEAGATSTDKPKSQDFGEAVKAAMTGLTVDSGENVDEAEKEPEDHSESISENPEPVEEEVIQDPLSEDEPSQLVYSHKMSPEETEKLFSNAMAEGEAKKKIIIGAAGSTDPVIDDNAKNPILSIKKQSAGYSSHNPNLHRGTKRPSMRA